MDEYDGNLRVFTTTSDTSVNVSLFIINAEKLKVVKSVEGFAPAGESVRSARFEKTTAYVCTSKLFTDPVFFFDLSDINNITYKDTGTIEGYSTSLVDFTNGYCWE
jgi:uncharacterized secreted protein with C-terminal beta-propeller domain